MSQLVIANAEKKIVKSQALPGKKIAEKEVHF